MKRLLSIFLALMLVSLQAAAMATDGGADILLPDMSAFTSADIEDRGRLAVDDILTGPCYLYTTDDGPGFAQAFEAMLGDGFTAGDVTLRDTPARLYTHESGARVLLAASLLEGRVMLVLAEGYSYVMGADEDEGPEATAPPSGEPAAGVDPDGLFVTVNGEGIELTDVYGYLSDKNIIFNFDQYPMRYQVTLWLPVDMKAGDVISTEWCKREERTDCWILFADVKEDYSSDSYVASNTEYDNFAPFPDGSAFQITIDQVSEDRKTYSGRVEGYLVTYEEDASRTLKDGRFRITLSDEEAADIRARLGVSQPSVTEAPEPTIGLAPPVVTEPEKDAPPAPLVIAPEAEAQWQRRDGDRLGFRVQVQNTSEAQAIRSFVLYYYTTDSDGVNPEGEGSCYYFTHPVSLAPGETAYSDYALLPRSGDIALVYCGVKSVLFADDSVLENPDVSYYSWAIR